VITNVELKGVERLNATLDDAATRLGDLHDAGVEAGRIISDLAAITAPRKTGALAGSIAAVVDGPTTVIGSDLIYAPPIHNGWHAHSIEPHPFLATAAERSQSQWVGAYERDTQRALDGVRGV
jgi:hypothetical protein